MSSDDAIRGLPRYIQLEIEKAMKPVQAQISALQQELADLKGPQTAKPTTFVARLRHAVGGGT